MLAHCRQGLWEEAVRELGLDVLLQDVFIVCNAVLGGDAPQRHGLIWPLHEDELVIALRRVAGLENPELLSGSPLWAQTAPGDCNTDYNPGLFVALEGFALAVCRDTSLHL